MTDDQDLLKGIAQRDPEAFRALLDRFSRPLVNLAYRFLGNQADAEEVAQDVFFRLYQHPPQLHPGVALFTWLYRVAVHRCIDLLRQRRSRPATVSLDLPVDPEGEGEPLGAQYPSSSQWSPREQVAGAELAAATRRAVASLPEKLRVPLVLSIGQELSHAEIARILGLSSKAVERRLARAREILKSRLAAYL